MNAKKEISKFTNDLPPWSKGIVAVAAIGGTFFLVRKLLSLKRSVKLQNVNKEITKLNQTQARTYPASQYTAYANKLKQAMVGYGTDEDAIFSVFSAMKNDLDVATLIKAFGYYKSPTPWYAVGSDAGLEGDLAVWLTNDLSDSDIQEINKILQSKGINYRF